MDNIKQAAQRLLHEIEVNYPAEDSEAFSLVKDIKLLATFCLFKFSSLEPNELLHRLYNYRASMAPHQRARQGGKLIIDVIDEIERLNIAMVNVQKQLEGMETVAEELRDRLLENSGARIADVFTEKELTKKGHLLDVVLDDLTKPGSSGPTADYTAIHGHKERKEGP